MKIIFVTLLVTLVLSNEHLDVSMEEIDKIIKQP